MRWQRGNERRRRDACTQVFQTETTCQQLNLFDDVFASIDFFFSSVFGITWLVIAILMIKKNELSEFRLETGYSNVDSRSQWPQLSSSIDSLVLFPLVRSMHFIPSLRLHDGKWFQANYNVETWNTHCLLWCVRDFAFYTHMRSRQKKTNRQKMLMRPNVTNVDF